MIITNSEQAEAYKLQLKKEYKEDPKKVGIARQLKIIDKFENYDQNELIPYIFSDSWLEHCDLRIGEWAKRDEDSINHDYWNKIKHGLYIYGPCGVGKSYALYALYRSQCLNGEQPRLKKAVEMLNLFRQDFTKNNNSPISSRSDYQRMVDPDGNNANKNNFEDFLKFDDTLYIDDIGTEKNTEFAEETLYYLINTRYENFLPTFFTSNLSIKELAERNGDRLASRIAGMCDVIELQGKDRRIKE